MSNIKLFESKQIRTVWNEFVEKWYFVVADALKVLTNTPNPSYCIKKMRKHDEELSKGGANLSPPPCVDTKGVNKSWIVQELKNFFILYNPPLQRKQNLLNSG